MISVRVPATSANLGPGYDAVGLRALFEHEDRARQVPPARHRGAAPARG